MKLNRSQSALLGATAISVAAWFVPLLGTVLRPIQFLNTHVHEFCHAVAAVFTGGMASKIVVHADGSGQTPVGGGFVLIVASAGYVGASAIGALLIAAGKDEKRAKGLLWALAGVLALSMLIWVRGDVVGVMWGTFWAFAIGACAALLRGQWAVFAVQFLGVQQCLNALLSITTLLQISLVAETQSDAGIMQHTTGIPAIAWAVLWSGISLFLVILALRRAWR